MALDQLLTRLEICTDGPGFTPLNHQLNQLIRDAELSHGVIHLTCLHTSCSLTINENADPRVLKDLAAWMDAVVPQDGFGPADADGRRRRYLHDDEGDDDMPAHIRTALTTQTMSLSVVEGQLLLGTWQAVYLWEHRASPHRRRLSCHLIGDLPNRATPMDRALRQNEAAPPRCCNAAMRPSSTTWCKHVMCPKPGRKTAASTRMSTC